MDILQIQKKWVPQISRKNLQKALQNIRVCLNLALETSLSITIRDDEFLKFYNNQFRDIDSPTDVLSFDSGEIDPETGFKHLGDILISYDRVIAQASKSTHSEHDELILLIVHGVLHLLGYDHANIKDRETMWKKQNEVLIFLGLNKIDFSIYDE